MKAKLDGLTCHHSIAYSRQTLGFEFSAEELEKLKGAYHPLVRTLPRAGRKSLYVASHASRVMEMSLPEGRLLLWELMQHAVQPQFVYAHKWRKGDLLLWDNRCSSHARTDFPSSERRLMLRTTVAGTARPY